MFMTSERDDEGKRDWREDELFSFLRPEDKANRAADDAPIVQGRPSGVDGVVINESGIPIGPDGKIVFVDGPGSGSKVGVVVIVIVLVFGAMMVTAVSNLSNRVRSTFSLVASSSAAESFVSDLRANRVDEVYASAPDAFRQVRSRDSLAFFAQTLQTFGDAPLTYEGVEPGSYPSDRIVSLSLSDGSRGLLIMVTLRPGADGKDEAIQFNTAMLTPGELATLRSMAGTKPSAIG
jgi:hypothetical protein